MNCPPLPISLSFWVELVGLSMQLNTIEKKIIHINEHNLHVNYCTNPKLMRIHTEIMWLFNSNDWVSSTLGHGSSI